MSLASTVTYTSVYTDSEPGRVFWGDDEELSDEGSPRVIVYEYDGLPMQPVAPPSPDYVPGPEHPPSHDYVPGLEHPPSPVEVQYVPEPEYPEYLVPSDTEAPLQDQRLPVDRGEHGADRSQSNSSHSSVLGRNINTIDFSDDNFWNDAQSSDDIFATQDEQ
ncbi:hypothetical protein Tco_1480891, partial [Tanacetum coccineum]